MTIENSSVYSLATADLCDRLRENAFVIECEWHRFGTKKAFCGQAITIKVEDDSALVRSILESDGRGRVLVVDNRCSRHRAIFGDRFGGLVRDNQWAGVVVNGSVRDVALLNRLDIGVLARGVCPRPPFKIGGGEPNAVLNFGGVAIHPGNWIVADDDGVVVADINQVLSSSSVQEFALIDPR